MSKNQYDSNEKANKFDKYAATNMLYQKLYFPTTKELFNYTLENKRVLDLACGTGQSTRFLAGLKPSELIGVDISQNMIDLAIERSINENNEFLKNIKYLCQDCSTSLQLGQFDVVFSIHYLHYADSEQKLFDMIQCMYESTKPGGTCLGIMASPFLKNESFDKISKYSLKYERRMGDVETNVGLYDGDVKDNELLTQIKIYLWPPELYVNIFNKCGFKNFEWCNLKVGSEFEEENGFFEDFLNIQPNLIFKAQRPIK